MIAALVVMAAICAAVSYRLGYRSGQIHAVHELLWNQQREDAE